MASLASFVASGVAFGHGTALRSVVLVLVQNMRMFALQEERVQNRKKEPQNV